MGILEHYVLLVVTAAPLNGIAKIFTSLYPSWWVDVTVLKQLAVRLKMAKLHGEHCKMIDIPLLLLTKIEPNFFISQRTGWRLILAFRAHWDGSNELLKSKIGPAVQKLVFFAKISELWVWLISEKYLKILTFDWLDRFWILEAHSNRLNEL